MAPPPRKTFKSDNAERTLKLSMEEKTFKFSRNEESTRHTKTAIFKSGKDEKTTQRAKALRTVRDDSEELSDVDENIAKNTFPSARKGTRKSTTAAPQTSRKSMAPMPRAASREAATPLKQTRRALSPTNTRRALSPTNARAARVPGDQKSAIERDAKRQIKRPRTDIEDKENRVKA